MESQKDFWIAEVREIKIIWRRTEKTIEWSFKFSQKTIELLRYEY